MSIVKKRRKLLKMSQKTLARKCKVRQSYISQLENYSRDPAVKIILILSKELYLCPVHIFRDYMCKKCIYKHRCLCSSLD